MSTLASVILRDTFANLPAASIPGRLFYAIDTHITYRDNGASWDVWAPNFADAEVPAGVIDGVNKVFVLAHAPNPAASLQLYLGEIQWGGGNDYTLAGNTATFVNAPMPGSTPLAWYRF